MALQRKIDVSSESLEYCNSISSKHQVWISQAEAILKETEQKDSMFQQQISGLNVGMQGLISRGEMEEAMGGYVGNSRSQWKSFLETTGEDCGVLGTGFGRDEITAVLGDI